MRRADLRLAMGRAPIRCRGRASESVDRRNPPGGSRISRPDCRHEGAAAGARWPGKATSGGSRGIAASPTVNAGGGQPAALAQEGRLMFDNVTGVEETRQSAVKGIRIGLFSGLIFGF